MTVELNVRVTDLEENGGGSENSSITELEERVTTLEEIVCDHGGRLTIAELNIEGISLRFLTNTILQNHFRFLTGWQNLKGATLLKISIVLQKQLG